MNTLLNFNKKHWLKITVILLLAITYASLRPLYLDLPPNSDKTLHLITYCLLILPAAIRSHKSLFTLVICLFIWSGVIELIQPYVGRYGEWLDLLANSCGLLIGVGIGLVISKTLDRLNK